MVEADYELNEKYARLSGDNRQQYAAAADDVADAVGGMLDAVKAQTGAQTPYETRLAGLDAMRQIFLCVCQAAGHEVGRELQRPGACFGWDDMLVELLGRFTAQEKVRLANDEGWLPKFRALVGACHEFQGFPELGPALKELELYAARPGDNVYGLDRR